MGTAKAYNRRRPHPLGAELNAQLRRLRSSEAACTSSICHQLEGLQDLHDCVDKLLLLPVSQQSLAQAQHKKWADKLLEGSIRLLDVCNTVKDALLQTKECSRELQSILRRRGGVETGVKKYLTSRKVVKKAIQKALAKLNAVETCSSSKNSHERSETVNMLKEAETITITAMESLLSFIYSSTTAPTKLSGWLLVSKLVKTKRIACEEEKISESEFLKVDVALYSLIHQATKKSDGIKNPENVQNQLKELDLCIQDLEGGLESLYRCLIKSRVSLLNILNH
ncbi:hypothetical protein HS088_TW02G00028 [Tripterygium wilfordii]|uniref:Uncharacterized protein n=1 Tax=Tripterygium wilfordii TaxID=458696 RepID=A0A7J7DXA6_TRIWF|nr:hypothetical protein HS088_TW02G00028 [Tripterygium wilfordii]